MRKLGSFQVLIFVAAVSVLAAGCKGKHEADISTATPIVVTTITLQTTTTEVGAEVPGIVRPIREAHLAPKIMSKVSEVSAREGDHVLRGEVLVRLESRDLAAGVAQSEAAVAAARAGEKQARTALQMQRVTSSVEVQQAEAALRTARANLAKTRQGPRPEQKQQAEQAVANAQAAVNAARARLEMLREGARKQERAQAGQSVVRAQQAVEAAHQGVIAAEVALRTAEADSNRIKNLVAQNVVARQQLDHVTMQYESAKAQLAQARAGETQANAALEQARQQQSLVNEGPRTQEVQQAQQGLAQAEAGLRQAQLDLDMATRGGRQEDVEAAQAAVDQAEQALRNARAAQSRNQLREADVQAARAAVDQARAGSQAAGVMLTYSTITAPFDGLVTARFVDPGSMATPGVPMLVIADDSEYRLEATVPEKLAELVDVGVRVKAKLDALQAEWDAGVVQVIPAADPASHSLLVKARLPLDPSVYSGLFGRLILPSGSRETLTVPETAVWREGSLTGVFVIADDKAELRMVQLGTVHDGAVEVNSGLEAGEVIAAETTGLSDGAPVEAVERSRP